MRMRWFLIVLVITLLFFGVMDGLGGLQPGRAMGQGPAPRVYRDRIEPHWLAGNARFWYRNDLAGGAREFVLVDAEKGTRQPAFDHGRLAEELGKMLGQDVKKERLPVEAIQFSADGAAVELKGAGKVWQLDLPSYRITVSKGEGAVAAKLAAAGAERPSRRTGPESQITFINQTKADVQLFWIDPDGNRQAYGSLAVGGQRTQHTFGGHVWMATKPDGTVLGVYQATDTPAAAVIDGAAAATQPSTRRQRNQAQPQTSVRSPDGQWEAFVREDNLWLRELATQQEYRLSADGTAADTYRLDVIRDRGIGMNYNRPDPPATLPDVRWSPDSRHLVAMRTHTVPGRTVYVVESSPKDQLQPKLLSYPYLKAGDEIPVSKPHLFKLADKREIPVGDQLFQNPWSIEDIRWVPTSGHFTFVYNQRGHQVIRIIAVDAGSGNTRILVEETSKTFIDYSGKKFSEYLNETRQIIWMSERDGWNHLYLYDASTGQVTSQITKGPWVVRGVDRVDHQKRQVWFRAGGIDPEQDPYLVHYCRVNFDGSGLVQLTSGNGTHSVQYSPDQRYLIDTYSRIDLPPVNELRRVEDGKLICRLEEADAREVLASGRSYPETFVAKGRDGVTDIFGVIHRPREFDPGKKYPVIEAIYAGPHGAFVPKTFRAVAGVQKLADKGFVIVQIDGMGTSQRSKKFHDVCWKNLVDAGFPDRILWMKAAAEKHPFMDLSRVGIYGGSAGGQNALGALLTHGEFYKVAVADCGCHDNRMDKIWWNEQWMGYPVGPHYQEQSNVTLAHKLQGKLMLLLGEVDKNVDPASTMQVVNALVKADKDFDLVIVPGAGHGAAGTPYGQRRQTDFFMRHLLNQR